MSRTVKNLGELALEIRDKPTALFLGAGSSVEAGGPTDDKLLKALREKFGQEFAKNATNTLGFVEELLFERGEILRPEIEQYVKLCLEGVGPTDLHRYLFSIPWRAVLTTNYDNIPDMIIRTIDGNRYIIPHDPTRSVISNVTIENLYIANGGIGTNGGGYDTFYNDYISNSLGGYCIFLMGDCDYNNITLCTIKGSNDTAAIGIVYGANYNGTITENNITGGIMIWLSEGGTVDRNYWSDYLAKYPNASEVDSSGIGNTPYVFSAAQNGSETIYYQDNHPLMKPVSNTIPEFPSVIIFAALMTATLIAGIVYSQKSKR